MQIMMALISNYRLEEDLQGHAGQQEEVPDPDCSVVSLVSALLNIGGKTCMDVAL